MDKYLIPIRELYWSKIKPVSRFYTNYIFRMNQIDNREQAVGCGEGVTLCHYGDVIMDAIASQITSLTSVYFTVYSDADQRKHQRTASLAFVRGIHRGPVNSPHKWPVTRKMFPFDDVIMPSRPISQAATSYVRYRTLDIVYIHKIK